MVFAFIIIPFFIVSLPQKTYDLFQNPEPQTARNLPSFLSPLSQMLVSDILNASETDLNNIDKVLNVSDMKKYASAEDVPCIWVSSDCIRKDYSDEDYQAFLHSFINIVMGNKKLFIKAKFATFNIATSVKGDPFSTYQYTQSPIRQLLYKVLEGRTGCVFYDYLYRLIGNLYLPLCAIFLSVIYCVARKKHLIAVLSAIMLISAIFIFFTATAAYFMYYFYIYLYGWLTLIGMILSVIKSHLVIKKTTNMI